MKRILTSFALVAASVAFSQVSISGETNDVPQATLDVKAITGKANGILVPRVSRAEAAVMAKPTNESGTEVDIVESTLIYVNQLNGTASGYATNVDANGFYYFKDGKWVKLGGGASAATQTWEQIKYDQTNGKFVMTGNDQTAPKDTWLIYGSGDYSPVRLPEMQPEDAGRMIVVYKEGSGNLQVQDFQGLVAGRPNTKLISESSVRANRGRTFIWTGEYWVTTNY